MDNSPPSAAENGLQKRKLGKLWAFLNRDVRTFKWWRRTEAGNEDHGVRLPNLKTQGASTLEREIASEVDPGRTETLRFRREVLDWRDEFHFQVTETASKAKMTLEVHIEHELANMGFLRHRLFTKPASDVLNGTIESLVQVPITSTAQLQQADLRQLLAKCSPPRQREVDTEAERFDLELDTRLNMKFTAQNRSMILKALDDLILGHNGLADRHRQWATHCASQILKD